MLELDEWIRRRVRLHHWKQWQRPRARRRNLIKLGITPREVHRASRSRKVYWRMSQKSLVRFALNNLANAVAAISKSFPPIASPFISR